MTPRGPKLIRLSWLRSTGLMFALTCLVVLIANPLLLRAEQTLATLTTTGTTFPTCPTPQQEEEEGEVILIGQRNRCRNVTLRPVREVRPALQPSLSRHLASHAFFTPVFHTPVRFATYPMRC